MNLSHIHILSSSTLLCSTIRTADVPALLASHQQITSMLSSDTETDHLTELLRSVLDTIKVELSTRRPS